MIAALARKFVAAGRQEMKVAAGRAVRRAILGIVAGLCLLTGLGFLVAAAVVALVPVVGGWQAAAIVGGAFLLIGAVILIAQSASSARRERIRAAAMAQATKQAATSPEDSVRLILTAFNIGLSLGRRDGK